MKEEIKCSVCGTTRGVWQVIGRCFPCNQELIDATYHPSPPLILLTRKMRRGLEAYTGIHEDIW